MWSIITPLQFKYLVSQGIDQVVDAKLIGGVCKLGGVPLIVGVFPTIAHV